MPEIPASEVLNPGELIMAQGCLSVFLLKNNLASDSPVGECYLESNPRLFADKSKCYAIADRHVLYLFI